jgi:DNA primase large subunit
VDKEKLIEKEKKRLKEQFKEIKGNKLKVVEGLIDEASYIRLTLVELKEQLDRDGHVDLMTQGSSSILREHPASKIYNAMIKNYTTIIKQLTQLLPKEETKKEIDDGFDDFVNSR